MDNSDWSNATRHHTFDTRFDSELKWRGSERVVVDLFDSSPVMMN